MADGTDQVLRSAWQATRLRRAFQPADPRQRLDLAAAAACWRALGTFAAEKLTDGRGAVLPKLGTFVLLHSGSGGRTDGGPSTPPLQLSREFVRGAGLVPAANDAPPRSLASTGAAELGREKIHKSKAKFHEFVPPRLCAPLSPPGTTLALLARAPCPG